MLLGRSTKHRITNQTGKSHERYTLFSVSSAPLAQSMTRDSDSSREQRDPQIIPKQRTHPTCAAQCASCVPEVENLSRFEEFKKMKQKKITEPFIVPTILLQLLSA